MLFVLAFAALWTGFSQLDFVSFLKVENARSSLDTRLGELIWKQIEREEDVIRNDSLIRTLDSLVLPICEANGIEPDSVKLHLIRKDEINAFALPGGHIAVYTGLIAECRKQEALQGVLGHEIAHLENGHVMRKLSKEIGLSVLLSAVNTGGGSQVRELVAMVSSSAYDRSLEEEADRESVRYLLKANIDPEPMADFMHAMDKGRKMPEALSWLATHPGSQERAEAILESIKGKKSEKRQTLSASQWDAFRKRVAD